MSVLLPIFFFFITGKIGREAYDVVVLDAVGLGPGAHDVGVIVGNDGDDIDTLGLDLVELGDVAWKVVGRAGWGEGTYLTKYSVIDVWSYGEDALYVWLAGSCVARGWDAEI